MVDFSKIILDDRKQRQDNSFHGTFLDYLKKVEENPEMAMISHERLYKLLEEPGKEIIKTEEDPRLRRIHGSDTIRKYNFFKEIGRAHV